MKEKLTARLQSLLSDRQNIVAQFNNAINNNGGAIAEIERLIAEIDEEAKKLWDETVSKITPSEPSEQTPAEATVDTPSTFHETSDSVPEAVTGEVVTADIPDEIPDATAVAQ